MYVDPTATHDLLEELTAEFLAIYKQCPSRLKKKIKASTQAVSLCCKLHNTSLPGRYLNLKALVSMLPLLLLLQPLLPSLLLLL